MQSVIYPEFKNKHILITGGASGIGKATTINFIKQGSIVSVIDFNKKALSNLKLDLSNNNNIQIYCADVSNLSKIHDVVKTAENLSGPVNVLVNNAGSNERVEFEKINLKIWSKHLTHNLNHFFYISQLILPKMKKLDGGSIINISSSAWMKLAPKLAAYHASKAGIIGLTCGMARDLGKYFIRVNAVAPGRVFTENEKIVQRNNNYDWEKETFKIQCIPKLIQPENIADTILWLASDQSALVTGQTIVIDGGVV